MSTLFNAAKINGSIGASTLVLNDYRLTISDIEGGHRLTVERGGEVQTMDVMDGSATSGTIDHRELTNRDAENQHPMSAIEGLETALEEKQPKGDYILNTAADLMNYYTKSEVYTKAEVNELVSAIPKFKIEVVTYLPSWMEASKTTIYLVPEPEGDSPNLYSEYIYVEKDEGIQGDFELLGTQTLDLTGYATEAWVEEQLADYQPTGDYATAADLLRLTGAGVVWAQSNVPAPTGQFEGIIYANGVWLAYGYSTGFYYSTDGMTWAEANIRNADVSAITYADGVWVASTSSGFCYSTDGMTWTESNIWGLLTRMSAYTNGIWVAGSNEGFFYSTDGMTWTKSNVTSGQADVITYADGVWVAGGYGTGIYYSTDGMTWTQSNVTSVDFSTIIYNGDVWVAGGAYTTSSGLYYSTDGMTWTKSNVTSGQADVITYADGVWVASTGSGLYYSTDGMTWTESNVTSGMFTEITYADGVWVAGGYGTGIYYSTDGMTWVETNVVTSGVFLVIAYADGVWVAGGYGTDIYYSTRQVAFRTDIPEIPSLEPYALKTEIPSLDNYALKSDIKSGIYSQTEQQIGTWINGKPIYRKTLVYEKNPLPANKWAYYDGNDLEGLHIDQYTNVSGICLCYSTNDATTPVWQPIPRVVPDAMTAYAIGFGDLNSSQVGVLFGTNYTRATIYLTIEYTKTTDTATIEI